VTGNTPCRSLVPAVVEAGEVRDWHCADISIAVARVRIKFDGTTISRNRRILAAKPTAAAFIDPNFAGGDPGDLIMFMRTGAAICGAMFFVGFSSAAMAESGIASIYAYSGEKTANGERARPNGLTAAHRTLPFGTRVRITNKRNGRSVIVRINDRGPFVRGRIIDVTPAAAHVLGFSGLAPVTVGRG
jgi:rare lipoprotein A